MPEFPKFLDIDGVLNIYQPDLEVQNLIDWVCLSEQIKENNNTIRSPTGEYKKIEPDCREGVRVQLER